MTGDKALANSGGGEGRLEREALHRFGRIILTVALHQVLITHMLIFNPRGLLGLDLRTPVAQHNEDRLSVGKTPVLGGLFRKSLKDRFNPAVHVGEVFLYQTLLMILPRLGPVSNVSKVVIAHQKLSWEPKPRPRKMRMSNLPELGTVRRNGMFLGGAHQTKRELLILVKPTIVKLDS